MLRLIMELHDARTGVVSEIGTLDIANEGYREGDSRDRGNYRARLNWQDAQGKPLPSQHTSIWGWDRQRKSAWELAYTALQHLFAHQNPAFAHSDQELYVKRGGKYVRVAQFEGFPMSGVFLVYKEPVDYRSWTGYEWLGAIPREDALTYAAALVHQERACKAVIALQEKYCRENFHSEHKVTREPLPPDIAALVQDYLVRSASPAVMTLVNAVLDAIAEGEKEAKKG